MALPSRETRKKLASKYLSKYRLTTKVIGPHLFFMETTPSTQPIAEDAPVSIRTSGTSIIATFEIEDSVFTPLYSRKSFEVDRLQRQLMQFNEKIKADSAYKLEEAKGAANEFFEYAVPKLRE